MAEPDARTDEQLMHACAAGDLAALDRLLVRYERRILSYACRVLGDAETARDVLQQTFLNIFERRGQYRETARFSTYVYRIAHNLCQNELRRLGRRRTLGLERPDAQDEESMYRDWLVDAAEPLEPIAREEEDRLLRQAVEELSPIYREVLALRIFEGLPFRDVAEITGANESTVKSRMRYALAFLDKALRGKLRRND